MYRQPVLSIGTEKKTRSEMEHTRLRVCYLYLDQPQTHRPQNSKLNYNFDDSQQLSTTIDLFPQYIYSSKIAEPRSAFVDLQKLNYHFL